MTFSDIQKTQSNYSPSMVPYNSNEKMKLEVQKATGEMWVNKQGHAACNGPAVFHLLIRYFFVCRMTLTAFSCSAHLLSSQFSSAFYSGLCVCAKSYFQGVQS